MRDAYLKFADGLAELLHAIVSQDVEAELAARRKVAVAVKAIADDIVWRLHG